MTQDVVSLYRQHLDKRGFVADPSQERAVERLQQLYEEWSAYKARRSSALARLIVKPPLPRGVYLWGAVGRGKSFLMDSFYLCLPLVRKRLRAARLPFEDRRVIVATASTLAISSLMRRRGPASAAREGLIQAIGAVPAVIALTDRDLAAYHGAEHKAIAAYEQGIDDVASVPKEHDRCGSNLIVPMMLLSSAGTIALERLVDEPSNAARALTGLAGASLAVEAFAWSDRHHGEPLAEAFHTPGREIQRLVATKEPTPAQLEVSMAAMADGSAQLPTG